MQAWWDTPAPVDPANDRVRTEIVRLFALTWLVGPLAGAGIYDLLALHPLSVLGLPENLPCVGKARQLAATALKLNARDELARVRRAEVS